MLTIRKAEADDVAAIWRLRRAAIYQGCRGFYPDEILNIWAEVPFTDKFTKTVESDCHLAILDERIVGIGMLNLQSGKVDGLFVDPDYMDRGVGKRMLAHLENLARASNVKRLHLDASLNAVPFYHNCGFAGQEHAIYQSLSGASLECVKMHKTLV
jgi:N-acetylglutamate synthase-like GNAT family acetyltransferase